MYITNNLDTSMNLGNKRTKSRFKPKYKITGKGWIVIGIALLLAFIEYSMYIGPFLNTIETINKRKAYDKECETLIERNTKVVNVANKYSSINDFKKPAYVYTYRDVETGKEFTFTKEKSLGIKKGDSAKIKVKKGEFIKKDVKKPKHNGLYVVSLVLVPLIGFIISMIMMVLLSDWLEDSYLIVEYCKDNNEYSGDDLEIDDFLYLAGCMGFPLILGVASLTTFIYSIV